jgi:hypothetical protein
VNSLENAARTRTRKQFSAVRRNSPGSDNPSDKDSREKTVLICIQYFLVEYASKLEDFFGVKLLFVEECRAL